MNDMRVHLGAELVVDFDQRSVERGGSPLPVSRDALVLLEILVHAWPAVVSKRDLYRRMWPDSIVEEGRLQGVVNEVLALDRRWKLVRIAQRLGYALDVEPVHGDRPICPYFLQYGRRRLPLRRGENLVGRDPAAAVRVLAPGVSRRHARITVSDTAATIEDHPSRNGTYVGKQKIDRPTTLRDGDEIYLGTLMMIFRHHSTQGASAL